VGRSEHTTVTGSCGCWHGEWSLKEDVQDTAAGLCFDSGQLHAQQHCLEVTDTADNCQPRNTRVCCVRACHDTHFLALHLLAA
jgi:hypothetical protein